MIMKFNIMRLIDILNMLNKFTNADKELAYAISKTKMNILNVMSEYQEQLDELLKTYGEQDENNKYIVSKESEKYNEYILKLSEILKQEVEVNVFQIPRNIFAKSNYYNPDCLEVEYDILYMMFSQKITEDDNVKNESNKVEDINANSEDVVSD